MDDLRQRLIRSFQAVFPELSEAEIPKASAASVGSWDSTASVTLLAVISEEFGVEIDPADAEDLTSFDLLLDEVTRKTNHA